MEIEIERYLDREVSGGGLGSNYRKMKLPEPVMYIRFPVLKFKKGVSINIFYC